MRVYLVRHGETDYNRAGLMQGRLDTSLNLYGVKQVHLCAKKLSSVPFEAIYTSPQKRAYETAEIISKRYENIDLFAHPLLQEMDVGIWEGMSWSQVLYRYPEMREPDLSAKKIASLSGGESYQDLMIRATEFLDWVYEFNYNKVLVVTHGGIIKSIVSHILDMKIENRGRFYAHNTGVTIIEKTENADKWKIVTLNDYSHLDADAKTSSRQEP